MKEFGLVCWDCDALLPGPRKAIGILPRGQRTCDSCGKTVAWNAFSAVYREQAEEMRRRWQRKREGMRV